MPGHNLQRAQVPFGKRLGWVIWEARRSRQGPALSEHWLLSLLEALSAPGLLSVTALLSNSRRQAEMGAPVPGPSRSTLFRKWDGGVVSGLQLLCLWLGRPESVSDGVCRAALEPQRVRKCLDPSAASLDSSALGTWEGSMGQKLWVTSENPKNSPGWMSTFKAQPEPSALITSLSWPWPGGEAEAGGHLPLLFPSTLPTLQLCVAVRGGGLGWAAQHLSRTSAGTGRSLPGELR